MSAINKNKMNGYLDSIMMIIIPVAYSAPSIKDLLVL